MADEIKPDVTIDLSGLSFPMPAIKMKKEL